MTKRQTPAFGWCGTLQAAADVQAAGLDYLELQIVPLDLEDDRHFAQAKAALRDLPIPVPVMSYLFPRDLRLVGENVHEARARAYMDRVVAVMDAAGASHVVYGSGWTRNVPEGFDRARAQAQFVQALQWMAPALATIGATLIIEPLNRKESNLCNAVREGVAFAAAAAAPNVQGLADFYHMDEDGEPLEEILALAPALGHVHLADTGRMNPGTGQYDYPTFFRYLKRGGYAGRLSAECGVIGDTVAGMRQSAAFMRACWAAA